jgi:hypothetical protein
VGSRPALWKKGCTRLAAASDKVYQLLADGRWFSPGTPASSTTKTGHNDIAEILLKVALSTINQIKSKSNHLQFTFAGFNFRGLAEIEMFVDISSRSFDICK